MGRTARAGAKGRALTFIEDDDRQLLKEVRLGWVWAQLTNNRVRLWLACRRGRMHGSHIAFQTALKSTADCHICCR